MLSIGLPFKNCADINYCDQNILFSKQIPICCVSVVSIITDANNTYCMNSPGGW